MPEEKWAAHGGIAACDLCHSRKVKCDRKDPCGNCANAKADCLRNRQKRPPRPRIKAHDKITVLLDKISSLENEIRPGNSPDARHLNTPTTQPSSVGEEFNSRGSKRKRSSESFPSSLLFPLGSVTSVSSDKQSPDNARELLEEELSHNRRLASYQQNMLRTAISLADELSKSASCTTESTVWNKVPTQLARGELMQLLLQTKRNGSVSSTWSLHSLDHLPSCAVEKMVLGLLDGKEDERILDMYTVNVHFKAALGLYASQLEVSLDANSRTHIKNMQLHHLHAALTALDRVSFMTRPSLLLLQTLLTGAILMQIVGDSTGSWHLTTHATRTLILLGHHVHREPNGDGDDMTEVYAAVAWCYHFDRLLSLLLLRPLSLPPYDIPVAALVRQGTNNPMSVFAAFMLETVPVMEKIVEWTSNAPDKAVTTTAVEQLRAQMESIYSAMLRARSKDLLESNQDYILHWQSLEFRYYALLTSIHRLSPTVTTDPLEREKCLASARKALGYVKQIQLLGKKQGHFVEDFSPYLSWTILSYPITPFFVLFCNVVSTYDPRDFQLLQEVVDSLSSLIAENKFIERLQKLCNMLLALCKPLVQVIGPPQHQQPHASAADTTMGPSEANPLEDVHTLPPIDAGLMGSWEDGIMSQLFNCQPSLDWFNSDIFTLGFGDADAGT